MSDLAKHMAELTPEKRKLVAQKLQRKLLSQQLQKNKEGISQAQILLQERRGNIFPLSFAQRRLWFLQQLEPQSPFYHISAAFRLTGWLSVEALERSLALLIQRHEVLRTTFPMQQEQPVQVVAPSLPIKGAVIDLHGLPADTLDRQVIELVRGEALRPFDLTHGPLLRVCLLRLAVGTGLAPVREPPLPSPPTQEHILLLTLHHIVADGWSSEIFMRELALLYQAQMNGEGSGLAPNISLLPDLPIQYADYTLWQQKWLQGEVLEAQLSYWRQQLAGIPALLKLPTDRPRPAVQRYVGAQQVLLVPAQLLEQLRSLSQREGVTLFMTLLATFQVLLMRYSGRHDVVVGTPVANRTREELEDLIGFFVNTLVLRTDLSGNPSFGTLLARVREVALQAYAHQDVPFEKLVEDLQPERDLSHQPLFQVLFSLQNAPPSRLELPGIILHPMPIESQTAKFDLNLRLTRGQEGLQAVMEYNTDLFDAATVTRMLGHWQVLLVAIADDPEQAIEELPLLTQAEREQLLVQGRGPEVQWNATQEAERRGTSDCKGSAVRRLPRRLGWQNLCLYHLFEQQAEQTPDAVALVFKEQTLTYAELNRRANQLAHLLRGHLLDPLVPVAICMERSIEMVIGLLAVLKAGGAYLPLDPATPQARLAYQLQESRAVLLLTQQKIRKKLLEVRPVGIVPCADPVPSPVLVWGGKMLCLEDVACGFASQEMSQVEVSDLPRESRGGQDLAYVIFTSGSTGMPKGVMVRQGSVVNYTLALCELLGAEPGWQYAMVSTPAADLGNTALFCALVSGGCVQVLDSETVMDAEALTRWVEHHPIDVLKIVPSHLSALLTGERAKSLIPKQALILGGETLPSSLLERLRALGGTCRVYNHYGPTETTIGVLVNELLQYPPTCPNGLALLQYPLTDRRNEENLTPLPKPPDIGDSNGTMPNMSSGFALGRPIVNSEVYVLDSRMQPVPVGVVGELYIGGAGLALGYIQQPEMTAERFVPHPFVEIVQTCGAKRVGARHRTGASPVRPYCADPGARLYRTGDLARYLPDGTIEYLGRIDQQVKLRGFRIELGEIEATLRAYPAVQDAVVVLREENETRKYLVAYVVPDRRGVPLWPPVEPIPPAIQRQALYQSSLTTVGVGPVSTLQGYLRERLPGYMIPTSILLLEKLPLTPNGKVDHKALPAPNWSQLPESTEMAPGAAPLVAPQTPLQEQLAMIWAEVLFGDRRDRTQSHKPQIGIYDNFFELGGHSLLATQLMARLRTVFQVEVPLRRLFETPTIAEMALAIKQIQGVLQAQILPQERHGTIFPLSFAQRRLWFLQQLEPQNAFYNRPTAFRLTGRLNVEALERSLALLIQRHEVLRTTFPMQEEQPVQVVAPSLPIQVVVIDLHGLPEARDTQATQLDRQVVELVRAEAQRPFDLAHGPLLRVSLLRLGVRGEDLPSSAAPQEHILLFTLHHIITDGWSHEIFMRELALLYQAQMNSTESELPPNISLLPELPIQYADYTLWQQQWLQGEVLEAQLSYWREQLAGAPALLKLPTDRPRPAVQKYVGAQQVLLVPAQLLEQLKSLSQQEGVTLFMTLLATFQVLLMRYSGQHDIVVGTPIANRTREELEDLIGFFVNTLVLRTDLSGNPTFGALLARVREVALQAYAHQDVPFEKLVEDLQPERDLSHQPLFQVLFSLQNVPPPRLELPGISLHPMPIESQTAKFDLSLILTEGQAGLQAVMEYNTDLFDAATVTRMLGHWQVLLVAIADDPEQAIETLPLLTQAEREQLIIQWNATSGNATGAQYDHQGRRPWCPQDLCLHQLVEQQVEQTPDAIAVVFEDVACEFTSHLTYHELNSQANQLAHRLLGEGLGPDRLVGVCMERSLELVVALLAVLKAGGAYVPLDPGYPQERLTFMLEDAQISLVLTQTHLRHLMGQAHRLLPAIELICLELDTPIEACRNGIDTKHDPHRLQPMALPHLDNPACPVLPENLAYLIYTSGSTGQPKGAMNTHQGICNRIGWMQQMYQLTPDDRVLQKTPFSFDVSVWEFFLPLTTGACMIVAFPGGHQDPVYLNALMAQQQVTTLHFVPSMLQAFLIELDLQSCGNLRRVICSGEALSAELAARFFARVPEEVQLHNLYGPTEAAIDVTFWQCQRETVDGGKPHPYGVPIGRPIANTQIYLLDRNLSPVPIGVTGELYIGGVGLARGYYGRPDLTAERFIANPFVGTGLAPVRTGTRLYRTGDLARYRANGAIEYLGRIDSQIKLRGFRIELGEIEATLRAYPAVQDAVVVLREENETRKYLVAYVVARSLESLTTVGAEQAQGTAPAATPQEPTVSILQAYLLEQLPDYMVPKSVVFLETLPLTPNGKVDRKALPPPSASGDNESTFVAPRSEMEHRLSAIWQEVLGIRTQVGIHENFFVLGGDSILSMLIVARARQAGLELTPKQIFQHQTIAQLAIVAKPIGQAQDRHEARSPRSTQVGPVPLTPIQRWFFEQDLPQPQHFNQAVMLQVPSVETGQAQGTVPTALVWQHLQLVVDAWLIQHDALRLRYEYTETGWHQRLVSLAEAGTVTVERLDLTQVDVSEQAKTIEEAADRVQASLDIEHGPLLRVVLIDPGNGQLVRLLIVIHHLVVDGVSWRVLLEDLQRATIGAVGIRRDSSLPLSACPCPMVTVAKTVSFQRWAEYLQELAQSVLVQKERAYWLKVAQAVTAPLPRDFPMGSNTGAWARQVRTVLTREETRLLLQEAPLPYRSHIQELLLVALLQTLARWMGTRRIRLDLEGHGREELGDETLDVSQTVGWFTSLYPVLFTLPQDGGVGASIKAIKEQLRSVPHKGIGYGLLRYLNEDSELREQLASTSEVSFNYLGQFDQASSREVVLQPAPDSSGETLGSQNWRSHLLDVSARVSEGQLHLQWTYSEQLHHRTTIERLAETLMNALRELLAHCLLPSAGGRTPSDFPLAHLDQATLDRLLAGCSHQSGASEQGQAAIPMSPYGSDGIEDLYPLTPLQQGLLFHTLYVPRSGVYIEQMSCVLRGGVEVGVFERAWQQVIAQHAILRTAFVWRDLCEPLQVVFAQVKFPVQVLDWRDRSSQQQEADLEVFLQADRAQGFDLEQAPLMRLTLTRLSETRVQMILTHHHLLLDGWSLSLVLQEMLACYKAEIQGKSLLHEERRPYRDFIRWLAEQEDEAAEDYWRRALVGINAPTPLGVDRDAVACLPCAIEGSAPQGYAIEVLQVEAATTARWHEYARQQRVTFNTLVQAAWALVLSRYSGRTDVIFGTVVAGRPPELIGVERMIGMFINTVPVRVQVNDDEEVEAWLTRLQEQQVERQPYEYTPLVQIQGWNGITREHPVSRTQGTIPTVPDRRLLFESLFVFENYPGQDVLSEHVGSGFALEVETFRVMEQTNYPLTIIVQPGTGGKPLHLRVVYDRQRFERATIERLLLHMQTVLQQLVADPQQKLRVVSPLPTIAIAATFTAEPIEEALTYWMQELNLPSSIVFAPYQQVFQQLLDSTSLFLQNQNGFNVLLLRFEDWLRYAPENMEQAEAQELIQQTLSDLLDALRTATAHANAPYLLMLCPSSPDLTTDSVGTGFAPVRDSHPQATQQQAFFASIEATLVEEVMNIPGVYLVNHRQPVGQVSDHNYWHAERFQQLYPVEQIYDDHTNQLGHIPYTPDFFIALATMLARTIAALRSAPYKVIVVDCDQTLWEGVCGEDGIQGISFHPAHLAFQEFLVAQQEAGMLLCLCSKNEEADVWAVFEQRPEMRLKREHLVNWRINWSPKSQNLRSMADELQLSLDSFIFIDDNPLECNEVQASCPQVLTLTLPVEKERWQQVFAHCWAFDHLRVTAEDRERTVRYTQERQRQFLQQQSISFATFLAGLQVQVSITTMQETQRSRVAQLTQRTNQFNCSTTRRTEQEIEQFCLDGGHTLVVEVSDRFGDYGLVGVVMYREEHDSLNVDTFLLSCRVLGRGVEHQVMKKICLLTREHGLNWVKVNFVATERNRPAHDFLQQCSQFVGPVGAGFAPDHLWGNAHSPSLQEARNAQESVIFIFAGGDACTLASLPADASPTLRAELSVGQGTQVAEADEKQVQMRQPVEQADLWHKAHRPQRLMHDLSTVEQIAQRLRERRASPAPEARSDVQSNMQEARTPLEELLVGVFQEVLVCEQVGIHENFFELGGHSLLATRLIGQVRVALGVEIPLHAVFEAPTVAGLALVVGQMQRATLDQTEDERLAQMLTEMGGLSEDDMQAIFTNDSKI